MSHFWPKHLVFPKIIIYANFKFLCYCNLIQKITKLPALICDKTFKTTFCAHFRPLLVQKHQNGTFPKMSFSSITSLYAAVYKSVSLYAVSIFHKTLKTSFWPQIVPYWPKNLQTRFFSKKSVRSILRLKVAAFSCKKIRKMPWHYFTLKVEKLDFRLFRSKNPRTRFFHKNPAQKFLVKWYPCFFMQNIENFLREVPEKT